MQPALKLDRMPVNVSEAPRLVREEQPATGRSARVVDFTQARHRKLLTEHTPLVEQCVRQALSRMGFRCQADELRSAAWLGLLDAVRRFDANRGIPFEAFARIRVNGAILDEVRQGDTMGRPSRRRAREIEGLRRKLTSTLKREPKQEELAKAAGESLETFHKLSAREHSQNVIHMEDLPGEGARGFASSEASPFDHVSTRQEHGSLHAAMAKLPERLQRMLSLYYQDDLSYREIGQTFGVSESRVCQLLKGAQATLREELDLCA